MCGGKDFSPIGSYLGMKNYVLGQILSEHDVIRNMTSESYLTEDVLVGVQRRGLKDGKGRCG